MTVMLLVMFGNKVCSNAANDDGVGNIERKDDDDDDDACPASQRQGR